MHQRIRSRSSKPAPSRNGDVDDSDRNLPRPARRGHPGTREGARGRGGMDRVAARRGRRTPCRRPGERLLPRAMGACPGGLRARGGQRSLVDGTRSARGRRPVPGTGADPMDIRERELSARDHGDRSLASRALRHGERNHGDASGVPASSHRRLLRRATRAASYRSAGGALYRPTRDGRPADRPLRRRGRRLPLVPRTLGCTAGATAQAVSRLGRQRTRHRVPLRRRVRTGDRLPGAATVVLQPRHRGSVLGPLRDGDGHFAGRRYRARDDPPLRGRNRASVRLGGHRPRRQDRLGRLGRVRGRA